MSEVKRLDKDIMEATEYLGTGGLGEVLGLADMARSQAHPKVQMDTDMAIALCLLAGEALMARKARLRN